MAEEATPNSAGAVKRAGRPREFDGTPVSVRLPAALHDALSVEAVRRGADLSDVIRQGLTQFVSRKSRAV
jgi:predicted HicB family RNase H-like nuclease